MGSGSASVVPLVIQKFGGATIRDAERVRDVAELVARTVRSDHRVVVTVSAMGKDTDQLLGLAPRVSSVGPGRELDALITAGEHKATALVSLALQELGIDAQSISGAEAGIVTDADHTRAKILEVQPDRVREALEAGRVPVVGGAQGRSRTGEATFIGRGGTDTTAIALAHALEADACDLYTDVLGVHTADPRIVPEARLLRRLSFDEMLAMCAAGCPKPATRAGELARTRGVVFRVRSAFSPDHGTLVGGASGQSKAPALAVVCDCSQVKVTLSGVRDHLAAAALAADLLGERSIAADVLAPDALGDDRDRVALTIADEEQVTDLLDALRAEVRAKSCTTQPELAKVSVIGHGERLGRELAGVLADRGIEHERLTPAGLRHSCVVREDDADRAARALHRAFGLGEGGPGRRGAAASSTGGGRRSIKDRAGKELTTSGDGRSSGD